MAGDHLEHEKETSLNYLMDTFSERYRAHVDAERRYVDAIRKGSRSKEGPAGHDPEAVMPAQPDKNGKPTGSMEEDFCALRSGSAASRPSPATPDGGGLS